MNTLDRRKLLSEALVLLDAQRRRGTMARLVATMADERNGYPSGGHGSADADLGDYDQTSAAALRPDKAAADLRAFDTMLTTIINATRKMDDMRKRYLEPSVLSPAKRKAHADEGCEVVAKVGSWEPVAHTTSDDGTIVVDGQVVALCAEGEERRIRLGSWAYGFARTWHRVPFEHEAEDHIRGRRIIVRTS